MEEQKVIVGEFENELYAAIAKRDLEQAGINANIIKNDADVFMLFSNKSKGVHIVISKTEIEKAKRILEIKFI